MAKPNYRHAKKQKELNRKLRQAEKQQRRSKAAGNPATSDAGQATDNTTATQTRQPTPNDSTSTTGGPSSETRGT